MKKIKYAVEQRLRLIDFLLSHYGYFNRPMIASFFGISLVQVSADIIVYKNLAPGNMTYNLNKKRFYKTDNFEPYYT